jgi:hypothetical protein
MEIVEGSKKRAKCCAIIGSGKDGHKCWRFVNDKSTTGKYCKIHLSHEIPKCNAVLTMGKNKGKKCGQRISENSTTGKYCNKHLKFDKFDDTDSSDTEEEQLEPASLKSSFLNDLPSEILGVILSFDSTPLLRAFEIALVNRTCYRSMNTPNAFMPCLPEYIRKNFPKEEYGSPFDRLKIWKNLHQVCSNFYCPISQDEKNCDDCGTRMCYSNAKKTYALPESVISELPFIQARNPHFSSAHPMKLYRLHDLREASLKKFGSWTEIEKRKQKIKQTADKRMNTREKNLKIIRETEAKKEEELNLREAPRILELSEMTCEQRRSLMESKLEEYKLEWRRDSKLLPTFVSGKWRSSERLTDDHVIALLLMTRDFFEVFPFPSSEELEEMDEDEQVGWMENYIHDPSFEKYSNIIKEKMKNYMLENSNASWIEAYNNVRILR